jgi:hypothetical protein
MWSTTPLGQHTLLRMPNESARRRIAFRSHAWTVSSTGHIGYILALLMYACDVAQGTGQAQAFQQLRPHGCPFTPLPLRADSPDLTHPHTRTPPSDIMLEQQLVCQFRVTSPPNSKRFGLFTVFERGQFKFSFVFSIDPV